MRFTLSALAMIAITGCSEYDVSSEPEDVITTEPDIVVSPTSLAYGHLSRDEQEIQSFVISNVGEAPLTVTDVVVTTGAGAFTVLNVKNQLLIDIGEEYTVDVAFSPETTENYGSINVVSDDPDTPEIPVDLLGFGTVPELVITPDHHQFNATFVPCGNEVQLELKNVGNEDLVITELDYSSGGLLSLDASMVTLPLTLAPEQTADVWVQFAAVDEGADTGDLAVTSNDPRGVIHADQNGEGYYANSVTESFTEPGVPPVDVMFLIDQSCSMEDDNVDDIELGIPPFLEELQKVSDWQLIQVTRFDGCANGGIIDENTPNAADKLISEAFNSPYHDRTEALLELASVALGKTGPGDCNYGFVRPGALLHIIVASDEREQSNLVPQQWVKDFEQYVADPALVKVSSIVDLSSTCGNNAGIDAGPGGYLEASQMTGGATLDICSPSWGSEMEDIASEVLAGIRTYNLANVPLAPTVEVTVNGVVTTDWDYSPANNSITVNSPPIGEGDLVEINYSTPAECE